jgi:hypothetical protein
MLFTASMSQQGLMTILHDSRVEVVQPSQIIHPDAKRARFDAYRVRSLQFPDVYVVSENSYPDA